MGDKPKQQDEAGADPLASFRIRRRTFLKYAGVSMAACSMSEVLVGCDPDDENGGDGPPINAVITRIRRPEDLMILDFEFRNFTLTDDGVLVRDDPEAPGYVILSFPRQHILEEVVPEADIDNPPDPPLQSLISGPTRVAFLVPSDIEELPYDLDMLLEAVQSYQLNVGEPAEPHPGVELPEGFEDLPDEPEPGPIAMTPMGLIAQQTQQTNLNVLANEQPTMLPQLEIDEVEPKDTLPTEPSETQTSIELPTRLIISPTRFGRFLHATQPVESEAGRVELWHTRLAAVDKDGDISERDPSLRTIRAVWVRGQTFDPMDPDVDIPNSDDPFESSLTSYDRNLIVHQTSNWNLQGVNSGQVEPATPVHVDRLMLSSLGGYLDARAEFTQKTNNDLLGWSHKATLGRDHYVRVVLAGYLYPFGHRASLVKISERKIRGDDQVAYLFKQSFLIIKEPVKHYEPGGLAGELERHMRQLPFRSLQFRQLVTPSLDLANGDDPFLPEIAGAPYRFPVHMTDLAGRLLKTSVSAVWVPGIPADWDAQLEDDVAPLLMAEMDGKPHAYTPMDGQRIRLAPAADNPDSPEDNTTYETTSVTFGSQNLSSTEASSAGFGLPFMPIITQAELGVESARAFTGNAAAPAFKYADRYLDHGFATGGGQNPGELLLDLVGSDKIGVDFASQSDKSGGFMSPSLNVGGLSRKIGAVAGDLDNVAEGSFDPESFFEDALPKLFGVIKLTDILGLGNLDAAPKFVSQAMNEVESFLADLSRLDQQLQKVAGEVASLKDQAEEVIDQIVGVIEGIGDIINTDQDQLGTLLDDLQTALQDLDQALKDAPLVPASVLRFAREAIGKVLSVLEVIDTILEAIDRFRQAKEMIETRTVRLEFRPPIKNDPFDIFAPNRTDGLVLAAEIRAKAVGGKPAGADLICSLEDFKIQLVGNDPVFAVDFERMQFMTRNGSKPDIDIVLRDVIFGGPLSFVEKIKEVIPLDGFSDPPNLEVSLEGVRANFSLPLPNVAVGLFALENMSISAGFHIPFLGDAIALTFGFCSRENPFSLTVAMLGGGGFVGLEITPDGIRLLEISLEFGASLAVDFGVASGGVEIKAGIYFAVEQNVPTLTGYFRFRGYVQVLRIIGASIELSMCLTWEGATGKVIGRATLIIEVTVLCFSASVELTAERKFAGSNGDPTFAEVYQPCDPPALPTEQCGVGSPPWANYVNAFALVA